MIPVPIGVGMWLAIGVSLGAAKLILKWICACIVFAACVSPSRMEDSQKAADTAARTLSIDEAACAPRVPTGEGTASSAWPFWAPTNRLVEGTFGV